jgi:hypothetical protein
MTSIKFKIILILLAILAGAGVARAQEEREPVRVNEAVVARLREAGIPLPDPAAVKIITN